MDGIRSGKKRVNLLIAAIDSLEPRRLLSAGQLDPSFGSAGSVSLGNYPDFNATAIASDSNGNVIVAGNTGVNNTGLVVERFTTDGTLDSSFGTAGKLTLSFGGSHAFINKILVESDNTMLVVGSTRDGLGNDDMAMAKLTAAGALDSHFGTGGKIIFDAGGDDDELSQAADSSNSTIVIAGSAGDSGSRDAFIGRIHEADGSFDTTFSSDGKTTVDFTSLDDALTGMTVLNNGEVDIATESTGYIKRLGLARLTTAGALDQSFSGDGRNTDGNFHTAGIFEGSGGKLLVFGTEDGTPAQIQVRRYNSDGGVDMTFGTSGRADITQSNVIAISNVVKQADGNFLIAGEQSSNSVVGPFVMRVNGNGVTDSSFTPPSFISSNETASVNAHLALGPDQRALLVTNTFNNTTPASGASTLFRMLGDNTPILNKGALEVTGTSGDDSIILGISNDSASTVAVVVNASVNTFSLAEIKSISVDGGVGDDSIVLTTLGKLNIPITIEGGAGDDIILGSAGADELDGGIGDDTIHGAGGNDTIHGEAGNDQLFGEKGDDAITGEAGQDKLSGGSDNDTLFAGDGEADTVSGDAGIDLADYSNESANLTLSLDGVANDGASGEHDNLLSIENVYGGSGNDRITGNNNANFLYGNAGNDTIHGLNGNDTIKGGSGRDKLFGDDDNDLLIANDKHPDTINGGDGSDSVKGDADNLDVLTSVETTL